MFRFLLAAKLVIQFTSVEAQRGVPAVTMVPVTREPVQRAPVTMVSVTREPVVVMTEEPAAVDCTCAGNELVPSIAQFVGACTPCVGQLECNDMIAPGCCTLAEGHTKDPCSLGWMEDPIIAPFRSTIDGLMASCGLNFNLDCADPAAPAALVVDITMPSVAAEGAASGCGAEIAATIASLQAGLVCASDAECPISAYCSPNTGKCRARPANGDYCNAVQHCAGHAECVMQKCEAQTGEFCKDNNEAANAFFSVSCSMVKANGMCTFDFGMGGGPTAAPAFVCPESCIDDFKAAGGMCNIKMDYDWLVAIFAGLGSTCASISSARDAGGCGANFGVYGLQFCQKTCAAPAPVEV